MIYSRSSPLVLLLVAALCFVGAYLSNHYGQKQGVLLRTDAARLQTILTEAELTAIREAEVVGHRLQAGEMSFEALVASTTYPCFVFRGSQLLYWSDHTLRPEVDNVSQPFREKLVDMRFGRFLAVRHGAGAYVIMTYIPLERHYGISNRYLREGAERALFRGLNVRLVTNSRNLSLPRLYSDNGSYLFSLESLQPNPVTGKYLPLALLLLGAGLYLRGWFRLAQELFARQALLRGTAAIVLPATVFRALLLYFGLPFSFVELSLFDPKVYAASWLSPSLGDLLINALLLLLVAYYGYLLFRRFEVMRRVQLLVGLRGRIALALGSIALFFGLLELLTDFYFSTFSNSQLVLDVTQSIQLSGFKLLLCLAIVLHTAGYLVGFYILSQTFVAALRPVNQTLGLLLLVGATLLLLPLGLWLGKFHLALLGITFMFFVVVRLTELRQLDIIVRYQFYLFMFLMLGICSSVGALALYTHFDRQLVANKRKIAGNLLVDNDLQGEYLLALRTQEMAADPLIRTALASTFINPEVVRQKIIKYYLRDYFDKYEIAVTLFDVAGRPVKGEGQAGSLPQLRRQLLQLAVATDQPNLYLIRGSNPFSTRRYVAFVPIKTAGNSTSTVLLELSLKKLTAYSVVPELLVDQKFFQPGLGPELSYAGYEKGRLVYSEGDFDYVNRLSGKQLREARLYTAGVSVKGFHHLAVRGPQDRTVIVTTATYSFGNWLANFSFLFLLHATCCLVSLGLYTLWQGRWADLLQANFATKIQLFLNFGILVPLLVVSVATASQVTSSYQRDLVRTYERRGKTVQENLLKNRAILADSLGRPALIDLADNVSALTETDLNLYDAKGNLLVGSQPLIFESGLLSTLMNPQAVAALAEHGQPRVLLTERAGSLSFNALYLPLRAAALRTGEPGPVVGYVGIPFFDSEKDLDNKLIELISTILTIFTVMLILFFVLTFLASRVLTTPLKLVTEKLKKTTLTGRNEMLAYQASDEIGLLVREYNEMLLKLEDSKQELATQEKEAAWREMARQVAHEIKNPLTPMKLSLQFLQRALAERRPNVEELIGRISQTLITQVDVLSDIATSFSTFTNLPAMRPERLAVDQILRRCVALHQGGAGGGRIDLHLPDQAPEHGYVVFADENLLVRTFNNLLINAIQAVPPTRKPRLDVRVELPGNDKLRLCFQDNGSGIPEAVREKIFVPNFTTKVSGSGIGLAVARRGIESAGGSIWFETEEGVGTLFCVELPLAPL